MLIGSFLFYNYILGIKHLLFCSEPKYMYVKTV